MKTFLSVALLLWADPSCSYCQAGNEPIPTEWLHDGNLIVPDFNFTVRSPTPESRWSYRQMPNSDGTKDTGFIVQASASDTYVILVLDKGGQMDSEKEFINGMRKSLPKGWQIRDVHIERTDVPIAGSSRITVTLALPDDSTFYGHGYAVVGKRGYMFMNYSREASESPDYEHFVASFALISPEPSTSPLSGLFIFLLWAMWGAIVDGRYVRRGGVKPTRNEKIWLLAAIGLCVGFMILVGVYFDANGKAEAHLTELFGILIFGLWEFGRWRVRRKNPFRSRTETVVRVQ